MEKKEGARQKVMKINVRSMSMPYVRDLSGKSEE